ncbi:MAG: hypothetical protein P8179_09135, partial [Candidatus Thiodiazotropha sp.]
YRARVAPAHPCARDTCASMHGAQRRGIARYSKELQRRHVPPQVCHSRCRVIHPVGDHNHRSYFLQNQIPAIRMERSTDFFRFKKHVVFYPQFFPLSHSAVGYALIGSCW